MLAESSLRVRYLYLLFRFGTPHIHDLIRYISSLCMLVDYFKVY